MNKEEIFEELKKIIVELVMNIEEKFDLEIPDSEAEKIATVEDVVEYILNSKK